MENTKDKQKKFEEAYFEGVEDGIAEDKSWVVFAIEKLIEEGKIKDKLVLDKIRKKIVETTREEKETWLKNGKKTIIEEIMSEEEYLKKLREEKRKQREEEQEDGKK